jgi:hypothetical protein
MRYFTETSLKEHRKGKIKSRAALKLHLSFLSVNWRA